MEKSVYIQDLFNKYINDTITKNELMELNSYMKAPQYYEFCKNLIRKHYSSNNEDINSLFEHRVKPIVTETWKQLDEQLNNENEPIRRTPHLWNSRIFKYVAAVLTLVSLSSLWYFYQNANNIKPNLIVHKHDLSPDTSRTVLSIEGSQDIKLSDTQEAVVINENGIAYLDGTPIVKSLSVQLATITTPRAGQYQLTLSDGSKVWLNNSTKLKYPTKFVGNERRVELQGEAYFEVAKDTKRPFRILSKNQEVLVLGTHFNINAYQDEPYIKTTLLEGTVKVTALDVKQSTKLSPGKQSILKGDGLVVRDVDTEAVMAWKNNDFMFRGQDLKTTMRQLARWYDVEIAYAKSAPMHLKIGGNVSRKNSLSSVLKAMESTNSIRFEFDGKTILVK